VRKVRTLDWELGVGSWEFESVAIIGRGLIGGSIELALRRLPVPPRIAALDQEDDLLQVTECDLVILAAPISENIRLLSVLPSYLPGEALITDTGSSKQGIVNAAAALPAHLHFLGGHPIAGAAAGGRASARADLFDGRPWILTPTAGAAAHEVDRLRRFVNRLGAAPHAMTPADHDRVLAFISHLPQLAVSALMHVVGEGAHEDGLALAGSGLRDSTRLANSPGPLWRDIVDSNRSNVNAALDQLIDTLQQIRNDEGIGTLEAVFASAAEWKHRLE
jgi:prephenate dehydrogenase